ncbi:hypothetical protein [Hoeflea sp.]|uniref:hypothetical protein n=1 Tax=Hoeflea sp. TaxID=1940281 RepID=UPI003B519DDF
MQNTVRAITLLLALTGSAAATEWSATTVRGEPGIRYEGTGFGVIISCNNSGNFDAVLITDKANFSDKWGGMLRTGSMVIMSDRDPTVRRNAYREDDTGQFASFASVLFAEHVAAAAKAAGSVSFVLVEGEDEVSFVADAEARGFAEESRDLISSCS